MLLDENIGPRNNKRTPERKTVVAQLGLRTGPVAREIPRPAGENAGLRDDADEKCTLLFQTDPLPSRRMIAEALGVKSIID
jgi:hypothetical protein